MKSENANRVSTLLKGLSISRTMTYEEKVILFKASRFLTPVLPKGTKNWIARDYIRYIDQYGSWYPRSASSKST